MGSGGQWRGGHGVWGGIWGWGGGRDPGAPPPARWTGWWRWGGCGRAGPSSPRPRASSSSCCATPPTPASARCAGHAPDTPPTRPLERTPRPTQPPPGRWPRPPGGRPRPLGGVGHTHPVAHIEPCPPTRAGHAYSVAPPTWRAGPAHQGSPRCCLLATPLPRVATPLSSLRGSLRGRGGLWRVPYWGVTGSLPVMADTVLVR